MDDFDLEAVYDAEISPLMTQIIDICKAHKLPMLATFCFRHAEDRDDFCTTLLPRDDEQIDANARAAKELKRTPGFSAFTITTTSE